LTNKIADFLEIQSNKKLMQITLAVPTTHILSRLLSRFRPLDVIISLDPLQTIFRYHRMSARHKTLAVQQ